MIIDAHCDTALKVLDQNQNLYKNDFHIDISRMDKPFIQFFATFIDPSFYNNAFNRAINVIRNLDTQIQTYDPYISKCSNYADILNVITLSKLGAVYSIEGGEALEGNIENLQVFYDLGVRSICLTWNNNNEIASGVGSELDFGLTNFGRSVVEKMNELGMLIDISHISEKSFYDVLGTSKKPIIASHSNAKKLCSHKRNLSDHQIILLKNSGGVIGINFYPPFLSDNNSASLKDIINHIEYISSLAGIDCVGIGADFDGVDSLPSQVLGVQHIDKVFNELLKLNYSQENVNLIAGGNFLRVLQNVLV